LRGACHSQLLARGRNAANGAIEVYLIVGWALGSGGMSLGCHWDVSSGWRWGLIMQSGWCLRSDDHQGILGFAVQDQIVRQFEEKRMESLGLGLGGRWERWEKIRWSLDRREWARLLLVFVFVLGCEALELGGVDGECVSL
jgi:hypothetical protein